MSESRRVLFLGDPASPLVDWLRSRGEIVAASDSKLDAGARAFRPDWIVSHGYRHILKAADLELPSRGAVNLHISLLPWNRGADPNFWSHVDGTPKGVTIHWMAAGVDTGDIIAQREAVFAPGATLRSTYDDLQIDIQKLFRETWPALTAGTAPRSPQTGAGSFHRLRDRRAYEYLLARRGWDTSVEELRGAKPRAEP